MKPLGTHHVAILTPNLQRLETFYTQTLGLPVTRRWDEVGIIFIDVGSTTIELIGREEVADQGGPHPRGQGVGINHIAMHVESVDDTYRELRENGVELLTEPANFRDEVRIVFFADPDGNVLELVEEMNQGRAGE